MPLCSDQFYFDNTTKKEMFWCSECLKANTRKNNKRPEVKVAKVEWNRKWRANDHEGYIAAKQRYYNKNKEAILVKQKRVIKDSIKRKYGFLKRGAKYREIPFNISLDEYTKIMADARCVYCSKDITKQMGGLDRIDNNGDYSINNVLTCCTDCNKGRGDRYTVEEFKHMIKALFEYRQGRI